MYMVFRGLPRGIFFCLLGMAVRLAALAAAAAAAALAAVLLVSSSQRPAALLQQRRRGPTSARGLLPARRGVRAPGRRRLDDEIIGVDVRSQRVDDDVKGSLVRFVDVPSDSVKIV